MKANEIDCCILDLRVEFMGSKRGTCFVCVI
jgi:hypothetical protein